MAVQLVTAIQTFQGLSTDTKPTSPPIGSTYHELDTGQLFVYAGDDGWVDDLRLYYAITAGLAG